MVFFIFLTTGLRCESGKEKIIVFFFFQFLTFRFLGLDNAGKTSLLEALTGGFPNETSPTLGYGIKQLTFNGLDFTIFDLGGQNSLREHWKNYYDKAAGIVWVIDSTDQRRLIETGIELKVILKEPKLDGLPLLIMANKQDLSTAMEPDQISEELLLHTIRDRSIHIQKCSALLRFGINEGMNYMTRELTPLSKEQIASKKAQEALLKKEIKEKERDRNLAEKKAKQAEKEERKRLAKGKEFEKDKNEEKETEKERKKKEKEEKKLEKKRKKEEKKKKGKKDKLETKEKQENEDEEKNEGEDESEERGRSKRKEKKKDKNMKKRKSNDDDVVDDDDKGKKDKSKKEEKEQIEDEIIEEEEESD